MQGAFSSGECITSLRIRGFTHFYASSAVLKGRLTAALAILGICTAFRYNGLTVDFFSRTVNIPPSSPVLMLAPMEGITNSLFREHLLSETTGPDIVATEFIRITNARQKVRPFPRHRVPLQIQIMGCDASMMQENLLFLKQKRVITDTDWIDLNVGCPSKKVTAKGAGAALLKTPELLIDIIAALRKEHSGPLSIKTRIGYDTDTDFPSIVSALKQTQLDFVSIHARSKQAGYTPGINLKQLAFAADTLPFPVIGNGDLWNIEAIQTMLAETNVRGLMLGRAALADPFLFSKIKSWRTQTAMHHYTASDYLHFSLSLLQKYQEREIAEQYPHRYVGAFKEFFFWLSQNPCLGKEYFHKVKVCSSLESIANTLLPIDPSHAI